MMSDNGVRQTWNERVNLPRWYRRGTTPPFLATKPPPYKVTRPPPWTRVMEKR